jgi:hypothetical protein
VAPGKEAVKELTDFCVSILPSLAKAAYAKDLAKNETIKSPSWMGGVRRYVEVEIMGLFID